ncbi:hypothetical protein F5Y12DRAFT_773824 [Xylaria sp. FL1777]|nr:hypothetical protein F5Y12DRAFT_773824 [Xylaria sp. FL1777]
MKCNTVPVYRQASPNVWALVRSLALDVATAEVVGIDSAHFGINNRRTGLVWIEDTIGNVWSEVWQDDCGKVEDRTGDFVVLVDRKGLLALL